jgi:hypothetical protein
VSSDLEHDVDSNLIHDRQGHLATRPACEIGQKCRSKRRRRVSINCILT